MQVHGTECSNAATQALIPTNLPSHKQGEGIIGELWLARSLDIVQFTVQNLEAKETHIRHSDLVQGLDAIANVPIAQVTVAKTSLPVHVAVGPAIHVDMGAAPATAQSVRLVVVGARVMAMMVHSVVVVILVSRIRHPLAAASAVAVASAVQPSY